MRLFTAICFDEDTKNALFSAGQRAKEAFEGNFSAKENLHLTLVFIGETGKEAQIEKALSKIEFPPFCLKIKGIGTFEKGILWAGIKENKSLYQLQKAVCRELESAGAEFENRRYFPHITLARKIKAKNVPEAVKEAEALLPRGKIKALGLSLMKSERVEGVLRYTEIYFKKFE